ncbi:hypothetical protein [Luteibacter yeojuensis]|uniref:Uncharacterized protein n=1 Tax=Luteibacter yeojuensis TaxID=345309 RepID=A0A7X5QS99_9GAMM|nr:hypothetical protein [Luteibacter yeojuensis]NID14414.1 hypothetical protein [Luteibacter yeojuensis]
MNHAEGKAHADQLRTAQHEVWATQLQSLRRHLPDMQASREAIAHGLENLQAVPGNAARLYGSCALDALADMHATIMLALEQGRDASARALARDAIGMAVNAAYVLDEPGDEGVTSALHSHLYAQRKRFTAWQSAEPGDEQVARDLESLIVGCRMSIWYALAPGWRTVSARAHAVDLGTWVDPALAAASSTEQDVAQDILNVLQCLGEPPAARQAAQVYRKARAASDALYLEAVALRLYGCALHRMALSLGDPSAAAVAEAAIQRMDGVLADHRRLAETHRNDRTAYIASFGPFNDALSSRTSPRLRRRRA